MRRNPTSRKSSRFSMVCTYCCLMNVTWSSKVSSTFWIFENVRAARRGRERGGRGEEGEDELRHDETCEVPRCESARRAPGERAPRPGRSR